MLAQLLNLNKATLSLQLVPWVTDFWHLVVFRILPPPASTKGPMWGYPVFVLGAISSFLEPFRGHLSPKIDKVSEELTLRYHHEEPWVECHGRSSPSSSPTLTTHKPLPQAVGPRNRCTFL